MDDELLNDFLAEASELIESLDADLLGLESSPNDRDVLNGVFRAFHTIKGGAGFLGLKALVDVCHRAEDLLNLARSDARPLDADDIDLVLRSVDEALEHVHAICFKTGPPGRVGVELEWTVHHHTDLRRPLHARDLRAALGHHAPHS
ncbi:MAG: Hpt domain-containing protein, partial [Gammaproteobacteria bacterium]